MKTAGSVLSTRSARRLASALRSRRDVPVSWTRTSAFSMALRSIRKRRHRVRPMIDQARGCVSLADQADRDRIAADLGSTLFVEAGAGSGKTTALVGRIVCLLAAGGVELADIAAITFTEAAAAELRQKL